MAVVRFNPEYGRGGSPGSKEKVFLDQYDWLFQSALSLTRGQKERAEDLVHDLFVQFWIKVKNLEEVEDLRGYLYGMLRNLYLSQLRSATRHPIQQLSILDHDSIFVGLRAHDFSNQLQATQLLTRACEFVSHRKETTLTAGIFILRYFHSYYPDEIAALVATERETVDRWLSRGRAEAKAFMAEPYPIPRSTTNSRVSGDPQAFLAHLRGIIFASCTVPCSPAGDKKGMIELSCGTEELSHLVSCPACLNRRSQQVGVPGLSNRDFDQPYQRDDRGGPPKGGSGTGTRMSDVKKARSSRLGKCYARTRELLRHCPAEVSIAVDGHVRTTHVISSSVSVLNLTVDAKERAEFAEILSEQGVRFLLLDRSDLETFNVRRYDVRLNDGRMLEVEIVPDAQGACIQVSYRDPGLSATILKEKDAGRQLFDSPKRMTLGAALGAWFSGVPGHLRIFGLLAVSLCVLAALSVFVWRFSALHSQSMEVLQKAIMQEQALPVDATAHAVFRYEEKDDAGHLEEAGQVEMWQQAKPRRLALRFYDAHHTMLRGFVQDLRGSADFDNQERNGDQRKQKSPLGWRDVPSAEHLASLLSADTPPEVTQSKDQYRIVVSSPRSRPELLNAVLVVERRTMRAVEADYDFRDEDGVRHILLREVSYEVRSVGGFDNKVFDFGRDVGASARHSRLDLPKVNEKRNTAALELQVLTDLMEAGAGSGEQVEVHRDRQTGMIEVRGVVDTPQRKAALLDAIAPLEGNPFVKISLRSSDELPQVGTRIPLRRKLSSSASRADPEIVVDSVQVASSTVPADAAIRQHFRSQGLVAQRLEEAIRRYAKEACAESLVAQQHAYRLAQLAAEFTPSDLAQLDAFSRLKWLVLVSNYSEALDGGLQSLRGHLGPVLRNALAPLIARDLNSLSFENSSELAARSRTLLSQTARLNQQVQSAFSIAAAPHGAQRDLQLAGDDAFAEIARLLDDAESTAADVSATAQHMQSLTTNIK